MSGSVNDQQLTPGDLDRFAGLVERYLGLRFASAESPLLRKVLADRMAFTQLGPKAYLDHVTSGPGAERTAWASRLTVAETYFLRHIEQFNALVKTVIPERQRAGADPGRLRLLSAGCATGEEAYSLALILRQHNPASQPAIIAADINPAVLGQAREGRYSAWSLRAVPLHIRSRWFTKSGNQYLVDPSLHKLIRFLAGNLAADDAEVWSSGPYDVVFCRNLLMYLSPEAMQRVVLRIAGALKPGGFLFLGSAENLRGMSSPFDLRETDGTFYYQRGELHRPESAAHLRLTGSQRPAGDWNTAGPAAPGEAVRPGSDGNPELGPVLELFAQERFSEALASLDRQLIGARPALEALLLRAALLTHAGRLADAEHACRQLVKSRSVAADAHLLLAIIRECEGDNDAAVQHCLAAANRDRQFALPHIHLGRLISSTPSPAGADRHFTLAMDLLPSETMRRMLLFGGGFDIAALISFCQLQLVNRRDAG